jgi:hypothetical protein
VDTESGKDTPLSRWWALPTIAVGAAITFGVYQVAPFVYAEAAGICSAVLFIVVVSIWKFHRQRWFWPFVVGAVLVEALAIWFIPWPPNHEFQKADLNFVWLDWLLLFGTVSLIGHFVEKDK